MIFDVGVAVADDTPDVDNTSGFEIMVRLRSIDRRDYAENKTVIDQYVRPTFVNVLRYELLNAAELRREMSEVAELVARTLDRPRDNVHVVDAPAGKGRIGFGGELQE